MQTSIPETPVGVIRSTPTTRHTYKPNWIDRGVCWHCTSTLNAIFGDF